MRPERQLIARCAGLSHLAYDSSTPSFESFVIHSLGFTGVHLIDQRTTDTQGFIAWNDTEIVVSLRGTKGIADMHTDLQIRMLDLGMYRVHTGFFVAIKSVQGEILAVIRRLMAERTRRIIVTGHSLGGALAMLCALSLAEAWLHPEHVITFGQPRVGDAAFKRYYNLELGSSTTRVVNAVDAVVRSPGVLLGYRHAGENIVFFGGFSDVEFNPALPVLFFNDAVCLFKDYQALRLGVFSDHGMVDYEKKLDLWLAREEGVI
jgi:hypothetical protein